MAALETSLSIPTSPHTFSSRSYLSGQIPLSRSSTLSLLPLRTALPKLPPIRMGGGPRTFPGGVSKWQWKRMQAKKAKQLLKARLARERQIYEMRKRAELKAAVAELERPWEAVAQTAPKLFSVSADEQVKVLADRFQRPGGFDMWSERDGPQLFSPIDGLPSARFFPKGVVHSTKPYGKIDGNLNSAEELTLPGSVSEVEDDVETDGYKNLGKFGDSLSNGGIKADKSIGTPMCRNRKTGSNGEFRNKQYGKIVGNTNDSGRLSRPSSVSEVQDVDIRSGYKNFGNFGDCLSNDGQKKAGRSTGNLMGRNQKSGSNGKFRKKRFGKLGGNSNGAERPSRPSSFSKVEDDLFQNGYPNVGNSIESSVRRSENSGTNSKFVKKKTRRFQVEKLNYSKDLRGSGTEVYDMDLRDDGTYGFEAGEL